MLQMTMRIIFCALLLVNTSDTFKFKSGSSKRFTRGVEPDRLLLYKLAKEFRCLDSSGVIPFRWVNDDYCDCHDGSDEPGTAACPNSIFYCINDGFKPAFILSNRVNDGVCDCCDGSDEYSRLVNCQDDCRHLGDEIRREEEEKVRLQEEGHKLFLQYCTLGSQIKEKKQVELVSLRSEVEKLELLTSELEKFRDTQEEEEMRLKEMAEQTFHEGTIIEVDRKQAFEAFQLLDVDLDERINSDELRSLFQAIEDRKWDVERYFLPEPVDFEQFVEGVWERFRQIYEVKIGFRIPDIQLGGNDDDDDDAEDDNGEESMEDVEYDDETKEAIARADEARKKFGEHEGQLKRLKNKLDESSNIVNLDSGRNNEFLPLYGRCFEIEDRLYIYVLCPFQSAAQKFKGTSEVTDLGKWGSWIGEEPNKYSVMLYKDGSECWNGPNRSVKVYLECGGSEELTSADEPGRCDYVFTFKTPALCTASPPSSSSSSPASWHHDPSDL